jgi:acetyl esterase/lipase
MMKLMASFILALALSPPTSEFTKRDHDPASPMQGHANTEGRVERNVVFGMYSGLALLMDIYYPAKPNGYGVIFIHGSGWSADEVYDAKPLKDGDQTKIYGEPLLQAGYTVFAINHRAAPRFRYPAQVEDAQRAVRFVRFNAQRFGVNPERIGAVGGSSGGHLVSILGTLDGKGDPLDKSEVNRVSAKVQCVVARAAPSEMISLAGDGRRAIPLYGIPLPQDKQSREYRQFIEGSPVTHVTPDDPPFLLLHGDADKTVPFSQSEVFEAALRKEGVKVRLVSVPGGGHGPRFDGAKNPPDYIGEMIHWLDAHLRASANANN